MRVIERPFSELLRKPNEVVKDLEDRDVVLRRRDAPALRLGIAERDQERSDAYAMVGRTLRNIAERHPVALAAALLDEFTWTSFLPDTDRDEFVGEFVRVSVAAGEFDNFAPLAQLLQEWQATAEVHADPELAARLTRPIVADGDAVPAPPA